MRDALMAENTFFIPLYMELKEKLENEILSSGFSDGSFFCTLKYICDKYKVSITTARKAVDALVQSGVVKSKSSRGIFISDSLKLQNLNSLRNYVLIFHSHQEGSQSIYFSLRLGALLKTFSENGITAKIIFTDTPDKNDFHIPTAVLKGIVTGTSVKQELLLQYAQMVPTLSLGGGKNNLTGAYSIVYDTHREMQLAAEYFHAKQIRELVFVGLSEATISKHEDIFKKQYGIGISVMQVGDHTIQCGLDCVSSLAKLPKTTAVFAEDDFIAVGIVEGFLKIGRDIREEKRILALATPHFPFTRQLGIPAIGYDPWTVGKVAADFLCSVIRNENPLEQKSITIEPEYSF